MSLIVKDMDMPGNCYRCPMKEWYDFGGEKHGYMCGAYRPTHPSYGAVASNVEARLKRRTDCPLKEVPLLDDLKDILREYFTIGDSYTYELTRVKTAFEVGTMTMDDFEEWTEDNIADLACYIAKKLNDSICDKKESSQ